MKQSAAIPTKVMGEQKPHRYFFSTAIRLIIQNDNDEIVVLSAEDGQYIKLPGAGIEKSGDHIVAAEHEAMRQTGCAVRVSRDCLAICEEWRNDLHQISYCYRAELADETRTVQVSEDEIEVGLKYEWCTFDEALSRLRSAEPTTELGRSIKEREIFFLEKGQSRSKEPHAHPPTAAPAA